MKYRAAKVLKVLSIAVLACAAISFVVMSLWNWLMPGIFAVQAITFWQALGLLVLSKILFGGFRPSRRGGGPWRRGMFERWEQMTPEERAQFKRGMRRGCGFRQETEGAHAGAEARA